MIGDWRQQRGQREERVTGVGLVVLVTKLKEEMEMEMEMEMAKKSWQGERTASQSRQSSASAQHVL